MKLALVLLILGTAFVVSEACVIRVCYWRTVYVRLCNAYGCRLVGVRRLVCVYKSCFGKRSMPEIKTGFPCNFAEYDKNGNDKIDKNEYRMTLKMQNSTDLFESFQEWDKTKDGVISCREFLNSEHEFECKPYGCTA